MWRGLAEWHAKGYKPTKAEIENIDEQWDSDLNMANALVAYMAQQNQMVGNVG